MDEIIIAGTRALTAKLRRPAIVVTAEEALRTRTREAALNSAARTIVQRVEVGSAVVEMLDSVMVDGRPLGDCTRQDLTKAADSEARRAVVLHDHAGWLRRLGAVIRPDQTVRTADRAAVIAILRERYADNDDQT